MSSHRLIMRGINVMSQIIQINDVNLAVKEYNSERIITLKEMDRLHQRKAGSAKKNFLNNREKFIEGEDYYMISLREFRELFSSNEDEPHRGNPDLNVVLLTEMGYLMLVKTFSDTLAWQVQRALVNSYFRFKQVAQMPDMPAVSEFDILHKMIDMLEESRAREDQLHQALETVNDKVHNLELRLLDNNALNQELITQELMKASDVAHQLKLYSVNGLPHNRIVGAIARKLGFKINVKNYYEDDYIVVMKEGEDETRLTWQIYYKPAGVDRIIEWFNSNKEDIYYEDYYQKNSKNGKAGDLREVGYRVGGVNWAVRAI
ncbi:ORF6N domain-containing protein [Heyndrickxia sporothermodurans]|uniref:ORF6N domain-containing protein n=1 Tax=Heyndrickxia sporothermodurans TaxID=46224 RepID=UPI0013FE48B1|nr:ORF6N domain-containing protein [Heyndrickxia sporothermodurans]